MFDFFGNKDSLIFILPRVWKAKGGKIRVTPPVRSEFKIIKTWTPFYHSHYPIIKGMLKGWMPFTGWILRKYAQKGDVLLSAGEPNLLGTYLYSRLARKRGLKHVFLTFQNINYEKRLRGIKLKVTNWLLRQNIKLSAGALCGTYQTYEVLKPYLNDKIKVAVIPQTGVDIDLFKPGVESDFRRRFNLEDKFIFLFAAVFDERKGVFTTINAFNETLKELPDARLVMIGIGKLWSQAKSLVSRLRIADKVTFIEWLPNHELAGIFSSVDVLVHPSEPYKGWEEQMGSTLLQASSSGLPVISTNIGGIPESIINQKTGILVEPKNIKALREAMIHLARHPEVRAEFGRQGRKHVVSEYGHKVVAGKLERFLNSL
ncbi:MAG: glycosyltransferase family 4 protein [Candidatus Yanofskybacteria bacterium]|nr:glycosyltransferase family 4 protein [Candidatus Yanofskybacteria bacterium]